MNHYPLFHHEHPKRVLIGAHLLRENTHGTRKTFYFISTDIHTKIVLQTLRNLLCQSILDSGSCAHSERGSWNLLQVFSLSYECDKHLSVKKKAKNLTGKNTDHLSLHPMSKTKSHTR